MSTLLDYLVLSPASQQPQMAPERPQPKRRRWGRERITKQDRIAAVTRLDEELRARRAKQAARWNAEELARQETLQHLPPGVEAVRQTQGQEGAAR